MAQARARPGGFSSSPEEDFRGGGLNQTGVSAGWSLPELWGASQSITAQVTNGENERLFAGNYLSTPSCLLRYTNYRDLSKDVYLDLGVTGLAGWNREWEMEGGGEQDKSLSTRVFGLDFTVLWEPTGNMRYRNVQWRTEAYLLNRDVLRPDNSKRDTINAWGAFTYLQSKVARSWDIGVRIDYFKPDQKEYSNLAGGHSHFTSTASDRHLWQAAPYVTWRQSPWVKVRLEYDHLTGKGTGSPRHKLMLQLIFAAGPHKHERY